MFSYLWYSQISNTWYPAQCFFSGTKACNSGNPYFHLCSLFMIHKYRCHNLIAGHICIIAIEKTSCRSKISGQKVKFNNLISHSQNQILKRHLEVKNFNLCNLEGWHQCHRLKYPNAWINNCKSRHCEKQMAVTLDKLDRVWRSRP